MRQKQFYAYILKYPDGTPFYVGKGCGDRCYRRRYGKNRLLVSVLAKVGDAVLVEVIAADDEAAAFAKEMDFIAKYGRRDIVTGILCNLTDGGEGQTGFRHSDAEHRLMSEFLRGNQRLLGHAHSPESCAKMSASHKKRLEDPAERAKHGKKGCANSHLIGNKFWVGRQHSPATRAAMSASRRGRRWSEERRKAQQRQWSVAQHESRRLSVLRRKECW